MKPVVRFTLSQIVFINVIFVLLIVAGVYALFTTPIENMPQVDMGRVFVSTVYYGASAEDVEKLVTDKIEDALDGLEYVEYIRSWSMRNLSSVDVKFIDDSDYDSLYDELRLRILNIKDELPSEVDEPLFFKIDTQVWMPVIVVDIIGDIPNHSLKLLADELKSSLLNIDGVREVDLRGEMKKEFHVSLDPSRLRDLGITFDQAVKAISSANTKIPTGRFRSNKSEVMLDTGMRLSNQEDVLDIVVRRDGDGNFIRIRDVATTARLSYRDPDIIQSVDGKSSLSLRVKKEESGNSIKIAEDVKEIAHKFEAAHKDDGIKINFTWDSTIEIRDSVNTLSGNLVLGIIMVTIVLWLTLGFRNAMLTAIGLPFAFLCVSIILKFTALSINTISIFSFVLVTGIIVDDAIIILENVFRHLQSGKPVRDSIIDGLSEVMMPVISSAITTVFAFIPMLIMTGSTGEFFSVIPKAVSFALIASLIEALIILPIHVLEWGPKPSHAVLPENQEIPHHLATGTCVPLWRIYNKTLETLLSHKAKTLLALLLVFLIALSILVLSVTGIMPLIKVKFFPASFFRYYVPVIMPQGTSIEETDNMVRELALFIKSFGDNQVLAANASAGRYEDEDYALHTSHHFGQVVVTLPDRKLWEFPDNPKNNLMSHLDYMRDRINDYIDAKYEGQINKPAIKIFPENTGPPVGKPVNIRLSAITIDAANKASEEIMQYLMSNPEFADLTDLVDDRAEFQSVVKYRPRYEAVYEYGLTPGAATQLVAGALNGSYAGEFRSTDEEIDLLVRIARIDDTGNEAGAGIDSPAAVLDIPIIEHSSSPVYLRDIVDLQYTSEPDIKSRYNGDPTVTITANIKSGSKLSPGRVHVVVKDFFDDISRNHLGVTLSFGGEFESTSRSYMSLTFAFFIAVLAIYVVLASQFKSYIQPIIILSAVAFSIIGVSFGMFISRSTFTVGSFLAIVGLAGVAVNDSLILIDFINVRRRQGKEMREAIIDACSLRMRPVLITTITTILGLLPMAIGIPSKSISWAPMATAFVTGLSSATILTLLIVPVEYELVEKFKRLIWRNNNNSGYNVNA